MRIVQRRTLIGGLAMALSGFTGVTGLAGAQGGKIPKLGSKLKIVIPAVSRSSLDQTGRALGDAMVGLGITDEIEYDNRDGKGGTLGLVAYAEKYASDPNAFFMGDTTLIGSIAVQKPVVDLTRVQPVARMTSDYLVVVVAASSPVKSASDLVERLRTNPKQTPMAIGTVGGVDHVFAGLLAKAAGGRLEDTAYMPFARGFELVDAVMTGKAAAGISGYSAFAEDIASGKLRALGVSAKKTAYGVKSLREQGVDVDLANWRAVFTGQGVSAVRKAEMVEAVKVAMTYELWKKTLKQSYWEPAWLAGPDLAGFLDIEVKTVQLMVQLLKLKA